MALPGIGQQITTGSTIEKTVGGQLTQFRINIHYAGNPAKDEYKYENRLQRRWPHWGTAWQNAPLSAYPGTPPSQYFWTSKSPYAYGWKQTAVGKATSAAYNAVAGATNIVTSATTSAGTGAFNVKKGPPGNLHTNPPLHNQTNGVSKYFRGTRDNSSRLGIISVPSTVFDIAGTTYSEKWGFRFLYNPTALTISASVNPGADPVASMTSMTKDMTGGFTTYSIELYLNRIADMKAVNQAASSYSPTPSMTDLNELWSRGTEYDLEFLYRVVNGDPKNVKGWRKTANIGFLFQQKVEMRLGDGFFAQGRIESLNVNHVMFTEMMVPTLTKVTIGFTQFLPDYS